MAVKLSPYKRRVRDNGGADRYGKFRDGKQVTPDRIAGKTFMIPFTYLNR